jgi:hypothetical protein
MKHIFASGEEIYHKNEKELNEGRVVFKNIEYEFIDEETIYKAEGVIGERAAVIEFKLKLSGFGEIKFRNSVKILMQSDLIQAEWEYYKLKYV